MRFLSKDDRRLISQTGIFGGIAKKRPDSLTFSLHLSFSFSLLSPCLPLSFSRLFFRDGGSMTAITW